MCSKHTKKCIEVDDSFDQQILLNEIHRGLALDCASYFINGSSERLRLNIDLPYSPVIIAAHALIAHKEWIHNLDRDRLKSVTDQLAGIKDSIDLPAVSIANISGSIDALSNYICLIGQNLAGHLGEVTESIDCAGSKLSVDREA